MRCTACGAELILTNVVPDDTGTVRGFEHHRFICSACHVTERRVIFTRHGGDDDTQAVPLHAAFDCACRSLHDIGQLDTTVKEFIAKRIVELARDSERDPNKLCEHALQTLGFFPEVDVPPKWTSDRAPLTRKQKAQQSLKIQEIGQALIAAGFDTLDKQATALEVPRSTAWTILKARHKNYGLSVKLINRMLASQHLPPLVRSKIIEYREEKTAGLYGGPQHSEPDLPQANRAYGGSPARRKVP